MLNVKKSGKKMMPSHPPVGVFLNVVILVFIGKTSKGESNCQFDRD